MDYSPYFQPIQINGMRLKNRISLSPMGTFTPMRDGNDSDEGYRYYEERAKGGIGLIQTGAMFLNEMLSQNGPTMLFDRSSTIPRQTMLVERCHRWGAKVCAQISCGTGRNGMPTIGEDIPFSASAVPTFYNPDVLCRPLTVEEIHGIIDDWRTAARNIKFCGFDAIEIHAHAGYLIDQFMSELWNKREDEYGGSVENRCRFAVEIIQAIRETNGPDFPIIFRIALDHMGIPGGRTIEDSMKILEILDKAGVDAFDIDSGSYENLDYIFPTRYVGESCMSYVCAEARKHTKKPLLNAGNHSPETGLQLLNSGECDIIQFGRQSIADPAFANKLKKGQREEIRPCLMCNEECIGRIWNRLTGSSCAVNPSSGFEQYMEISPLKVPQNVVVIGGGPGGMEAARVAALRGCNVTLYEKSDKLGGTFGIISSHASFKKRNRELVAWYELQLKNTGVKVVLNTEVKLDDPILCAADAIFVATGSNVFTPAIPGIDNAKVVSVVEAHKNGVDTDGIVICGGGLSGCDSALEYYEQGMRDISIVEMREDVALDAMSINKITIDKLLKKYGIKLYTSSKVVGITDKGVEIENAEGKKVLPANKIVTAFGMVPNNTFADAVQKKYPAKTSLIGDCVKTAMCGPAIREGFYAAMALQD